MCDMRPNRMLKRALNTLGTGTRGTRFIKDANKNPNTQAYQMLNNVWNICWGVYRILNDCLVP